jgi:hypothetical protein
MEIVVNYSGGINKILDQNIKEAMKSIGCEVLTQGIDTFKGERDIVFTIKLAGEKCKK